MLGSFFRNVQPFLKFLCSGKSRNCSVQGALAESHWLKRDSDIESELAYSWENKKINKINK